ncbi:MAG: transcriptional regulator [Desulfobacterium sp.]|nr:transcriptional regulator [Desulfobacterium sp.]
MATPKPGTKVRGSQSGRPIMVLLDLLGRRWSLRILWELYQNGPSSFRTLQKLCGDISPTVLNARLSDLREAGIIELLDREGYVITAEGLALGKIIEQLNMWAEDWAKRVEPTKPRGRVKLPAASVSKGKIK